MAFITNCSTSVPIYLPRAITTVLDGPTVSAGATQFNMAKGYVGLNVFVADSSYSFNFSILGGYGSTLNNPNSALFIINGSNTGCTIGVPTYNPSASTTYIITTPVADGGGRSYRFVFYNYPSIKPTVQLQLGAVLTSTITITSNDAVFQPPF